MGGIDAGTTLVARTDFQLKPHESFAPESIVERDPIRPVSTRGRTLLRAKPPAWATDDLPCVVPKDDWTLQHQETHWDVRTDAEARELCAGCPVGPLWDGDRMIERGACLEAAMGEEQGLGEQYRYLVRGGHTPKGRWSLDQTASSD
ncbi:MAG: hypothetical protein ACXVGQ_00220 [Mycobacteriaceae bacterium]